jgi:hypothetical protein
MPVNEFEKQVQQKMDELKFPPSPEVWTEVEKHIRKEKRRRRVIFWWLMPLLLVGGGVYYYSVREKVEVEENVKVEDRKDRPTIPATQEISNIPANPGLDATSKTGYGQSPEQGNRGNFTVASSAPDKTNAELEVSITPSSSKKVKNVSEPPPAKEEIQDLTIEVEKAIAPPTEKSNELAKAAPVIETSKPDLAKADTLVTKNPEVKESNEVLENRTKDKKEKWTFGFATEAGSSNTISGSLIGGGQARFDYAQYANPPGVGSGTSNVPVYIPAPDNGLSLGFALFANKKLSERISVRASLQYNRFATHISTGNRIDSTRQIYNSLSDRLVVDNYYRPPANTNNGSDFTNRYHLIGLSASLGWKIIKSGKFSLSWENGLGLSRLVSTNALHYDSNLGVYYSDFDPFKKTQVMFTTGLSSPIIDRAGLQMAIYPFMTYGLSPVLKSNSGYQKSHYLNYGVGLRFSFSR